MKNKLKIVGYEKFWNVLTGAGAGAALVPIVLYIASIATGGYVTLPTSEAMTVAVGGIVVTILAAINSYMVPNSKPETEVTENVEPIVTNDVPVFER